MLPARLRRRLEKVAFPDAQVTNDPLRALLHVLSVLEDMPGEVVRLALEGSDDEGEWSRWLFCLLWGPTLLDVVDRSSESPRRLELDPRLIRVPMPEVADLEEDFEPARAWAPLRLVVDVSDGGRRRFRWNPLASTGLVAFGALLHSDGPAPGVPFAGDLDSLCERFTDPRGWSFLAAGAPHQLSSLPRELAELRKANLARMRLGLTADALDEYLEAWAALAERARDTLIPSNAPDPELAAVVLADIVELHEGRLAMLATHPLRLRWVARHLRRMTDLLVRSLATGLNLNRENTELFFEWLDRASPHGTPPFIVGADETVAIPSSARSTGTRSTHRFGETASSVGIGSPPSTTPRSTKWSGCWPPTWKHIHTSRMAWSYSCSTEREQLAYRFGSSSVCGLVPLAFGSSCTYSHPAVSTTRSSEPSKQPSRTGRWARRSCSRMSS